MYDNIIIKFNLIRFPQYNLCNLYMTLFYIWSESQVVKLDYMNYYITYYYISKKIWSVLLICDIIFSKVYFHLYIMSSNIYL